MEIEQFNESKKGYFKAVENKVEADRMTYSWAGKDKFIINHTESSLNFQKRVLEKKWL